MSDDSGMPLPLSPVRALARTLMVFAFVGLAWLAVASFLPHFHVADASFSARVVFVCIVLALMASILLAQVAMLRTWFRSLAEQRPDRTAGVAQLRVVIMLLVLLGVGSGVAVLWYATVHWMPQVQASVEDPAP